MPTVSYKCGNTGKMKKRTFPYNAMGKAQAVEFAKTMGELLKTIQIDIQADTNG